MLRSAVAHVVDLSSRGDAGPYAMTMFNRGENGVLVWAGQLRESSLSKPAEEVEANDFAVRETVSFMSWRDIEAYYAETSLAPLVEKLIAGYKRKDTAG